MGELDRDLASLICSPSLLRTFSDTDLMDALHRGCNDALAVLFERHSALVFRIARAILRDDGEAEETVQRVFLDVFRAVNQFNPDSRKLSRPGCFSTHIIGPLIAGQHLQANHFYNREEFDDLTPAELFYGAGHLLCLPPQEVACLVEQVLALLEPHQRKVIELTYFEGLTAEEIAKTTGDSASSVRHNLYRGLEEIAGRPFSRTKRARANSASERKTSAKGMLVEHPRTL